MQELIKLSHYLLLNIKARLICKLFCNISRNSVYYKDMRKVSLTREVSMRSVLCLLVCLVLAGCSLAVKSHSTANDIHYPDSRKLI